MPSLLLDGKRLNCLCFVFNMLNADSEKQKTSWISFQLVSIGMTGFEPATPRTPCVCSTKLSYIPKWMVRHFRLYKKSRTKSMANFALVGKGCS